MRNEEIAQVLTTIADMYDILGIAWKPQAFQKAARQVANMKDVVKDIYQTRGVRGLQAIEGVGKGIATVIEELLQGTPVAELETLRKRIPSGLLDILRIPGIGPKKVKKLFSDLGIDSLDALENAAQKRKIRELEGFGEKTEKEIAEAIPLARNAKERTLLGDMKPVAERVLAQVLRLGARRAEIAGSVRRMKETCKDIDILIDVDDPKRFFDAFVAGDEIQKVVAQGETKAAVLLRAGMNCDVRVVPEKSFGAALQYFTGSKDHNVHLRSIASRKGYKLSEYGLFKRDTNAFVCGRTEKEVYQKLGVPCVPPELRENRGEFDIKKIPTLITEKDIRGDLQMHTTSSDGMHTIEEMVHAAQRKGYEYIAITDHSSGARIQNGLSEQRVRQHFKTIETIQNTHNNITILKGAEVNIRKDGSLDYTDTLLKNMDVVVAAIHERYQENEKQMTQRICRALKHPHVTFLAHPTGRLINRRKGYAFDFDKVCSCACDNDVALEINAQPSRLDLNDTFIRRAIHNGVRLCVNTDAHSVTQLDHMTYGVAQARRGWASKKHILNTLPLKQLRKAIQKTRIL